MFMIEYDVRSITVFDDNLSDTKTLKKISESKSREQYSAFMKSNDYVSSGIGISRRSSKAWTPAKIKKDIILAIANKIFIKLDDLINGLKLQKKEDSLGYFSFFNVKNLDGIELNRNEQLLVNQLLAYLYVASKNKNKCVINDRFFINILSASKNKLQFDNLFEYECPNCGITVHNCSCGNNTINIDSTDSEIFRCTVCNKEYNINNYSCNCGEHINFVTDIISSLILLPSISFIKTLVEIIHELADITVDIPYFIIRKDEILIINKVQGEYRQYNLYDLSYWRIRAKIQDCVVDESNKKKYMSILNKSKEKCPINAYHPRKEDCLNCSKRKISLSDFEEGRICLQRIFGIPIEINDFDGIHNGNEKTDIIYEDSFYETNVKCKVGIHFKSRVNYTKPIGRGNRNIKGLMSQYIYSLYKNAIGKYDFNIIGISIPNIIETSMKEAFIEASKRFNISFICIEEES